MSDGSCILHVHPTTAAVHLDKATIVLEFLAIRAGERGDTAGEDAWRIALDAAATARTKFCEARQVQSNRRNATKNGEAQFQSEELYLRFVLKTILDLLEKQPEAIGVHVYKRAREILETG